MENYKKYLKEIAERKIQGLHPKPIESSDLLHEIILQIKDPDSKYREESLHFFIYNVVPGTTDAAKIKAAFLKSIIKNEISVKEIDMKLAFELLSHMKGGPSIEVLLDIALDKDITTAKTAAEVLKTQVFLYEKDTDRLKKAYHNNNNIASEILNSESIFSIDNFKDAKPNVEYAYSKSLGYTIPNGMEPYRRMFRDFDES